MYKPDSQYSVSATQFIRTFKKNHIQFVTTVPDMLQIALHQELENPVHEIRSINCTTEDQAIETAAGIYAGGSRCAVLIQNQGFYAAINSIRALGLDGHIPLFLVIGQFGREFANLGHDPRQSDRLMVRMLEPVLDTLGIPYQRLESEKDANNIEIACKTAFERNGPSALLVGHFVSFS